MKIIHHPQLLKYFEDIQNTPKTPLTIRCYTYKAIAGQSPPHLDGILANAVCKSLNIGWIHVQPDEVLFVPTPLAALSWFDGLPFWACNNFESSESIVRYTRFCQKSGDNPLTMPRQMATLNSAKPLRQPPSINGQYQHYLLPLRTELADHWETTCLGDLQEIEKLLPLITHIGKKTKSGYGVIAKWEILEAKEFNLSRLQPNSNGNKFGSWTNPHWNPKLWRYLG